MTLHDAIQEVFFIKNKNILTVDEIQDTIASERIYANREGNSLISNNQILSRIRKYPDVFHIHGNNISLIDDRTQRLNAFHQRLLDILRQVMTHDIVFLTSIYFYQRIVSNRNKYQHFLSDEIIEKINHPEGFNRFLFNLPNVNSKFHDLSFDVLEMWMAISKSRVSEEIFNFFSKLDLSENEYSDSIFNTFLYEKVYASTFMKRDIFITPLNVIRIISGITQEYNYKNLYNPAAGFSSIPINLNTTHDARYNFVGEEINDIAFKISLINLSLNGFNINNFEKQDSITDINHRDRNFDLIVCNPPFGLKLNNQWEFYQDIPIKSKDFVNVIIQKAIQKKAKDGKAIIIIPENILFSSNKADIALRQHMVKNNMIEQIISLPPGVFSPKSAVKTNILVLGNTSPDGIKIIEWNENSSYNYNKEEGYTSVVSEPGSEYSSNKTTYINKEQIDGEDFNLVVSKYFNKIELRDKADFLKLGDVCDIITDLTTTQDTSKQYLNIKDLNKKYFDINLDTSKLEYNSNKRKGKLLINDALLLGSFDGSLKPTLFEYKGKEVLVSPNIYILKVKTQLVKPEYLVFELASQYIENQIKSLSYGATSLKRIRINDLLSIEIKIPSLDYQQKILDEKKETLFSARLDDINKFADNLGVTKLKEKELLGFVKHEMGNIIGGVQNNFKNVLHTLNTLNVDLSVKVSKRNNAPSLEETLNTIEHNLTDVGGLMSNIQAILDLGNSGLKSSKVSFKDYFQREIQKTNANEFFNIHLFYENEKIVTINPKFTVDTKQFAFVIKNFIQNSIVHGLRENERGNLVFNLSEDEDFYYISMINDGKPFPKDFSFGDFLSFGKRFDTTKGSGLGGYLIGKVIENHQGSIKPMESGTGFFLDGNMANPQFIEPAFIKVGVQFLIQIPKNEM